MGEEFQRLVREGFGDEERGGGCEFDYIIIGPKIGIIVIEVKSFSLYCSATNAQEQYSKALGQVHAIHALLHFVQYNTGGIRVPDELVRKILFLPNVRRCQFKQYEKSLTETGKVEEESVEHFFKDHTENEIDTESPQYYLVSKKFLENAVSSMSRYQNQYEW